MKTVLITGASRGIGRETAIYFAERGYRVYANYNRSETEAIALQTELQGRGFDVHIIKADVSKETEVEKMFCEIAKYSKRLDILVNNAGVALYRQIQDTTAEEYDLVMNINCKGMFLCSKYAVALMLDNDGGSIVNISSMWGLTGASCESVYSMSKFATVGLTLSLNEELSDSGINVNCVCPPLVLTDMCKHLSDDDISEFTDNYGKVVTAREVASKIYDTATADFSGQVIKFTEEE